MSRFETHVLTLQVNITFIELNKKNYR